MDSRTWVITAYFNPVRYARRLENYRLFRAHLNAPLLAVELGYGSAFELGARDADILIQRRGRDILWQKERLLNIALDALPSDCTKVVYTDCDVIFESADWLSQTGRLLDRFALVQPFSRAHRMSAGWAPPANRPADVSDVMSSPPFLIASGLSERICMQTSGMDLRSTMGLAWGVQRDVIARHRFYDACVVGGGDSAFVRAAYGYFEDVMRLKRLNDRQQEHYLQWARPFHAAVQGSVSYVGGNLLHLWHGSERHRQYTARNIGLVPFRFDPFEDIGLDENHIWRWSSHKRELHAYVRDYFLSRREDS